VTGKYALIIANTEYTDPGLAQLTAPGKDAKELVRVLDSPDICGFDDVIVLFNEVASKVSETIDYFLSNKKPSDLLILYFSGHGVRDEYGSLYLAVKNTNRERLRSTAIKSDFIREAMDQSRSKRQILILDCCNSGAFAQGTKGEIGGSVGTASAFEGTGYGRVVLTASDSTQFAWEGDKVIGETENSLFTNFLVKGLEGEADTDGDGRITIDELYDYAYEQIVNLTPKQTPGKWSYKQQGEILLRQNIRIEDTKPVPLPDDLVAAMNNSLAYMRESAVSQLDLLLKAKNRSLAHAARLALERIATEDDSRRVAQAAAKALERNQAAQSEQKKSEADRSASSRTGQLRREKMEQEIRFKAEKSELEKRLQEAREVIDTQQKIKAVGQTTPGISPARLFGIAVAALMILGVGYAAFKFLPALSKPAPSETSIAAQAPTEVPVSAPVTGNASSTPVGGQPTASPTPADAVTMTTSAPAAEKTDAKGVMMVVVPTGDFSMGSNTSDALDEKPSHTVSLDEYYIDKFEVTNALYKACVDAGKCDPPKHTYFFPESPGKIYYSNSQYDNYPVVYVDWNMAKTYCEWRGAHLPTEAQWEKAARGGTDTRNYPWGNDLQCRQANYLKCVNRTSAVGSYSDGKSPYGAYDMAGNVLEWVADWYSANYYGNLFSSNPTGPISGQSRVVRGGSWTKFDVRVSNRVGVAPNSATFDIGFRCVGSLP
jgi:formylglycine-generating enzyme required for sulfatase activity